jgi:hypothetical protein
MRALNDISREQTYGLLEEEIYKGIKTAYTIDELHLGYRIFKEIIKNDL